MSRFAKNAAAGAATKRDVLTTNAAGGDAYEQTARVELANLALTSVIVDGAHRSGEGDMARIGALVRQLDQKDDLKFAAQVALYTRHVHGLRTITHILAGEIGLCEREGGYPWRRKFFDKIVRRLDDAVEIVSYIRTKLGRDKMLPNAVKRGIAAALVRFDEYALSKYSGSSGDAMRLTDVVNLVRPKSPKSHPLHKLMTGKIASAMTWEFELSEAGKADNPETAKAKVWAKLFREEQMGYMATLMNLRNIATQAPKTLDTALSLLTSRAQVKKSLVLPTQFIAAYKAVAEAGVPRAQEVLRAINEAIELAMDNVPVLKGSTLIALDASNSMNEGGSFKFTPFEIGSLFAAVLYKANKDVDFMYFADETKYLTFDQDQKLLHLCDQIVSARIKGGTNFHEVFNGAKRSYDRIVLMSDMQAWMDDNSSLARESTDGTTLPHAAHAAYCKRFKADPVIYTFDLKNHGTSQFPTRKVAALAGWTDKVFTVMAMLEKDRNALIHEIEKQDL